MSTQQTPETATDALTEYEISDDPCVEYDKGEESHFKQSRRRQYEVARDWIAGVYPNNERSDRPAGQFGTSSTEAYQYDDGTGRIRWNRQTEAVRTVTGLVLINSELNSGGGFGSNHSSHHISRTARDNDFETHRVPFPFLDGVIDEQTDASRRRSPGDKWHYDRIVHVHDDGDGTLYTYAHGEQIYVGRDSTAHGSGRFGFAIQEAAPVPEPARALDLLLPHDVRQAQAAGAEIPRQGEWFFVPEQYASEKRSGSVQKPGVAERPYGYSPLDSHVPRDWATSKNDEQVIEDFIGHEDTEFTDSYDLDELLEGPQQVVEFYATGRLHYESSLTWDQLQNDVLGGVWVRGTVRHDDRDHYVENLGDEWHKAVTHDYDVVTQDDVGRMRVD